MLLRVYHHLKVWLKDLQWIWPQIEKTCNWNCVFICESSVFSSLFREFLFFTKALERKCLHTCLYVSSQHQSASKYSLHVCFLSPKDTIPVSLLADHTFCILKQHATTACKIIHLKQVAWADYQAEEQNICKTSLLPKMDGGWLDGRSVGEIGN